MAAPEDLDARTEPATQRRRDEARQQGRVTFSGELSGGVLLLAAMVLLAAMARTLGVGLLETVRDGLTSPRHETLGIRDAENLLGEQYQRWLTLTGGFLGLL